MPINPKPAAQPAEADHSSDVPVVHVEDEAAAVAALNAGAFVSADPAILEKLGFADLGARLDDRLAYS